MKAVAGTEVGVVATGIVLYIWRWQYAYPNFALLLLGVLITTFFVHRDRLPDLGFGSQGLVSGLKIVFGPTLLFAAFLITIGLFTGSFTAWSWDLGKLAGFTRYFAFCLFQEFGLQSFFTNRLLFVFRKPKVAAWGSAIIFAVFHIPNPVLMPVTFLGGYVLSRIFVDHRSLIPLALAQAIVGTLLAIVLPPTWHHGLRVGPGYYR